MQYKYSTRLELVWRQYGWRGATGYIEAMPRPEPVGRTTFEEYLALEACSQVRLEFEDHADVDLSGN